MINIKLGNKLRELRKKRNLKQSEVAELTNLNVKTIQRYEKGENIPENFLYLFVEKLELSNLTIFELKDIFFKDGYFINFDAVDYHIKELLKIIGYEIECIDFLEGQQDTYIIKNMYTGDIYHTLGRRLNFSYGDIILNILRSFIEEDLKEAKPINYDYSYLKTEEYQKILKKYYNLIEPYILKQFELKEKIDKINEEEEKEIEELKQKLKNKK